MRSARTILTVALVGAFALGCGHLGVSPKSRFQIQERFPDRLGSVEVMGVEVRSALPDRTLPDADLEKLAGFLAHDLRQRFRGRVSRIFGDCDLLVAPAWMRQNLTLDEFAAFGARESDWPELIRFTAPFDIAGTPTLSLPAGHNADGAPFGFQLIGPHLGETTLLRAGHAYQQATDWHRRRPPLEG